MKRRFRLRQANRKWRDTGIPFHSADHHIFCDGDNQSARNPQIDAAFSSHGHRPLRAAVACPAGSDSSPTRRRFAFTIRESLEK